MTLALRARPPHTITISGRYGAQALRTVDSMGRSGSWATRTNFKIRKPIEMAGRKPGTPKTGGRQKGSPNKATAAKAAEVAASGLTPLDYMLNIMRDEEALAVRRDDMAKAAAPYVHPKLAAIEHSGPDGGPIEVANLTDAQLAAIATGSGKGTAAPKGSPKQAR